MRRLLGRAALAGAVTLLALGPATVSRADEPAPTSTVQPGQTTPSTDQAEAAEETAARVAEQQDRIGRLARAVYQGGGSLGNVSMLLEAQSPSDFAERLVSLQTVVSSQRSVLDDLATVQASFGQQSDDLER